MTRTVSLIFFLFLIFNFENKANLLSLSYNGGDEEYLAFAEVMPEPEGGMGSIIQKIKYPEIAQKANLQGKVYVLAFIDDKGNCTSAKVIKGIGGGCDEAAVDAIKATKFKPGKSGGANVKVKLSLPIEFKLRS
jgi:protein TonB